MVAADISRATATRRLTGLVEKGLLTAYGQGRGAYYALSVEPGRNANPPPVAEIDATRVTLQAVLSREQSTLAAQYAIAGLGLLQHTPTPTPSMSSQSGNRQERGVESTTKLVVCFEQVPDLATFFSLQQQLATLLHREITLLPDFSLSPEQMAGEVEWIWQK